MPRNTSISQLHFSGNSTSLLPSSPCLSGAVRLHHSRQLTSPHPKPPLSLLPSFFSTFSSAEPLARSSLLPAPLSWTLACWSTHSWPADFWPLAGSAWGISLTAGHNCPPGKWRPNELGQLETGLESCWLIWPCVRDWGVHPQMWREWAVHLSMCCCPRALEPGFSYSQLDYWDD